jgi:LmbE family N-acetylglucosaminyl deacetylase
MRRLISSIKHPVRAELSRVIMNRCREFDEPELAVPAIAFSPHPDDETLGCGGTIALKRSLGAEVDIVFLTDGSGSHPGLIDRDRLRSIRRREAISAASVLGVPEDHLHFMDERDTSLEDNATVVRGRVLDILERLDARQVFVTHRRDPPVGSHDHRAANSIVISALRERGERVEVLEYPVWMWRNWPWVSIPNWSGSTPAFLFRSALSWGRLSRDLNLAAEIEPFLDLKREALDRYESQMAPDTGSSWPTLRGVSGGQFLECFFRDRELFAHSTVP